MAKVCILNSTSNVVENICEVADINNIPSFLAQEGQVIATDHTGSIGDTWNGSSYDVPNNVDNKTDQQKWFYIRERRNKLLAETDWTQSRDVTLSNDSAWKTYRQQLRDLPTSQSDPDDVVFPTKP
tara:strand:+ start:876 stop:1253 length:378 start_codon:yes stop_codon:yes gene_type:complete